MCPFCKSNRFAKLKPNIGKEYGIIEVDEKKGAVYMDAILPVDLYGCLDCKSIFLKCESLMVK